MNANTLFSEGDESLIRVKGTSYENVESQLLRFKEGFSPTKITKPAIIDDGIQKLSSEDLEAHCQRYENAEVDVMKFVPASGAATRMFKSLFSFLDKYESTPATIDAILREDKKVGKFFTELDEFAFFKELDRTILNQKGISAAKALKEYKHNLIVETLLFEEGMGYGKLPKGLLSFHEYTDHTRTAAQEHLSEGLDYANKKGKAQIHFTVSQSHKSLFEDHIAKSIEQLNVDTKIEVSFSVQFPSTDTIAATTDFGLFRDEDGNLLFRPAGHGALLENLNSLSADLIFIKNIDNVVPDRLRQEAVKYKKCLAGLLIDFQHKSFKLLKKAELGESILEEGKLLLKEMGTVGDFSEDDVRLMLDRPIRVCGMVKNEGEPGGGPFWVKGDQCTSLQIVESAQVDKNNKKQLSIFKSGTHFNPVDIVCGVKNYKGEKYDLLKYRDDEAGFISEKSYNGNKILAMELPGLWNGSMSNWNTIFVEVPLITFNPVKSITDLLKPAHR